MPDVNKGATLQQIYTWLYNGGSYGKRPCVADIIEMGWLPLLQAGILFWETGTNKDLRFLSPTTAGLLTDANSLNTTNMVTYAYYKAVADSEPRVGPFNPTVSTPADNGRRRIGMLALTTDGIGAVAATALHTGPAGYYPVVKLLGVFSPVVDASTEFDFTVSAGALIGPARIDLALTAYGVTTIAPYGCPVFLWDLTDASVINVAVQGGPVTQTLYLIYQYWSET